ncbi:putative triacylglycerol lipase [Saccharata proteae CBS 121410]|uniref:Carboxylic ester hydrolase n=1 Tax=Saccharata proteae CBS 121410 TaxID=1314787 RepID=A0A9P4HYV6_9PEZI|nr:putative triacylglycerol lipase [Saccharata proteae CBS 121410]
MRILWSCVAVGLEISVFVGHTAAVQSIISLDYATYQGTSTSDGISQWLGIRYAAPPLGHLRFSAPEDPDTVDDVQQADQHGPTCLATGASSTDTSTSEDCLFLDVYAPSNATSDSKLPVFFWIQGGGFNSNSNANYNGRGLITASGMNMVVVTFNYRVGPYGFLASQEVLQDGSVNNGLKDQIKALKWVQKYIKQFGGDPEHVVVGGASAGAASVTFLLTAYGGRDDGLFHATAAESQSFGTMYTVSQSQFMYDNLVIRTNCASSADTLACLRSLNASTLQDYNFNSPYPGAQGAPLYMYSVTIDGDMVPDYTYRLFAEGKIIKVPTIFGDDLNGGTIFAPKNTNTIGDSDVFQHNQFPALTLSQVRSLNQLYPVEGTPEFPGAGRYWRQASDSYGQMRYTCPGLFCSTSLSDDCGIPSWNYLYSVHDPTSDANGYGVSHTIEVNAIFGPNNTNGGAPASYYTSNAGVVPVIQGYWTSFIRSYDPNKYRLPGTPKWERWNGAEQPRLVFNTGGNVTVNAVDNVTRERCSYLNNIGVSVKQ